MQGTVIREPDKAWTPTQREIKTEPQEPVRARLRSQMLILKVRLGKGSLLMMNVPFCHPDQAYERGHVQGMTERFSSSFSHLQTQLFLAYTLVIHSPLNTQAPLTIFVIRNTNYGVTGNTKCSFFSIDATSTFEVRKMLRTKTRALSETNNEGHSHEDKSRWK